MYTYVHAYIYAYLYIYVCILTLPMLFCGPVKQCLYNLYWTYMYSNFIILKQFHTGLMSSVNV